MELVALTGGGHIAEFRFTESSGLPTLNPLWTPPWKTIEPFDYRPRLHAKYYGSPVTGKTIAGIAGHNICLDYFGPPSEEEAAQGLSIHGEAPVAKWRKTTEHVTAQEVRLTLSTMLPVAGLQFTRDLRLRRSESVIYFRETVVNERKADHFFHWTQHVTLGPPFLAEGNSSIAIPATRGLTYPHGYEERALLASSRMFQWPDAPALKGGEVDLTQPFLHRGLGFVASALLDPQRETEFIAAHNHSNRLLMGYCFRRVDFPWVAVWEENCARSASPWNSRVQARGLEFGSSPIPITRREAFALGNLFDTPTFSRVAARGRKAVQYVAFLAQVPEGFGRVSDISIAGNEISVRGAGRGQLVHIAAAGLSSMGLI